jgi:hypothetical protein
MAGRDVRVRPRGDQAAVGIDRGPQSVDQPFSEAVVHGGAVQ